MSNSGRSLGREGFQAMIGQWEEAWDEFRLEIEDVVEEGDAVVVSVAQYGRGRGSGIERQMGAAHLMRFRDGLLSAWRLCQTGAEAMHHVHNLASAGLAIASRGATLASMKSMAGPVERRVDPEDSPNLRVVMEAFERLDEHGVEAAVEHLLDHAHPDVEFYPYMGAGKVLRGPDEVRAFYRSQLEMGTSLVARPSGFEDCGDEVLVNGSLRVVQPTGGFAESQLSWTYRFRDGRLQEVRGGPRRPAVAAGPS